MCHHFSLLETCFAPSRRAPTATFHDSKHNIVHVHFDATRGWLLTSGTDKVIKVGRHILLKAFHLWPYVNIQEPQDCVGSAHKVTQLWAFLRCQGPGCTHQDQTWLLAAGTYSVFLMVNNRSHVQQPKEWYRQELPAELSRGRWGCWRGRQEGSGVWTEHGVKGRTRISQRVINKIFSSWDQLIQKHPSRVCLRTVLDGAGAAAEAPARRGHSCAAGSPSIPSAATPACSGPFLEAAAGCG